VLRLLLGPVSCIIASLLLRPFCGGRLSVVFKERLLAHHLSYHECSKLAIRGIDCSLSQQSIIKDPQLFLPA
jgi:hypothetical protein